MGNFLIRDYEKVFCKVKSKKGEKMGKIKLLSVLGMIILILTGCLSESDRAERVLQKHLKERYGEEFVIYGMGKRAGNVRRWYEAAVVYPKSYIGTRKENDSYYWGKGFVELNNGMKGGDTYGGVLLNESANKFYGKKLKELFGENYLAVIDVKGPYSNRDFEKEMESRRISLEKELGGIPPEISGGIYIFGRVENDKDREWYRKQIYEFIQFMKETGTFEYVSLGIIIVDDRILTKQFENNNKLKQELSMNRELLSDINFRKKKKELMKQITEKLSSEKIKIKLEGINRTIAFNSDGGVYSWSFYNSLLYSHIYSEKYIKSQKLDHREKLKYDKIEDVKFRTENY